MAGLDTSSALGAFERMEEKVMSLEAQAEAANMVSGCCTCYVSPLHLSLLHTPCLGQLQMCG